jgi:hypothetical protein
LFSPLWDRCLTGSSPTVTKKVVGVFVRFRAPLTVCYFHLDRLNHLDHLNHLIEEERNVG